MGGVSMEWKEVTLGEISSKIGDGLHGTPKYDDEGPYYFINGNNLNCGKIIIKDDTKRVGIDEFVKNQKELNEQTLLVSINGTIGNVAKYNNEPCILGKSACYINVIKEVDKEFIYYVLTSANFKRNITNEATGTTIKNVSLKQMREYKFNIPCNIADQHRIASILTSLDRKIELNNKINADLEEMAQAIFKNWFVDFEPFKDDKFVDSELGMIPEGWKVGRLTDVIKLMPGGTPKTSEPLYWDNGTIPFFSPKDVNGVYCFATEKHITEAGLNKCSSNLYPKDTIFITCRGTVGKVCLVACDMAMNQSNYAIKAIDGYSQYYVFFLVKSVVERLIKKSNGAVFSAITSKDFDEEILIPSQKAVEDFTNVIDGFFRRIFTIGTENSRLSLLRDTLLPRLMSGELEVPE